MTNIDTVLQHLGLPIIGIQPGDYEDEEGYICCGNCHTRKQADTEYPDPFGMHKFYRAPVLCKCRQEAEDKKQREQEHRKHLEKVKQMKEDCFLYPAMHEHRFDNADLVPKDMLEKAKRYVADWDTVKSTNTGLLYWGDTGTGKSYLSACIANALIEQEIPVLMRSMGDFMSGSFEEREALCKELARYDLLVLDDLGMERGTEYGLETAYRVINTRCEIRKPTIITTNLTLDDLKKAADTAHKRIYDRVLEMCVPVCFSGPNIRDGIHKDKKELLTELFGRKEASGDGE